MKDYLDIEDWNNLSEEEEVKLLLWLYDFAIDVYEFIKPMILKDGHDLPLIIETCYNSDGAFAIQRPRCISLYLFDVIRLTPSKFILTRLVYILTHELFHVNQEVDRFLYGSDPLYDNNVERSVKYMAYQFLINNRDIIEERYGMCLDIQFLKYYIIGAVYSTNYVLKKDTISEWEVLLDENKTMGFNGETLREVIEKSSDFIVEIRNCNIKEGPNAVRQYIKHTGEYLMPDLDILNCYNDIYKYRSDCYQVRELYTNKNDSTSKLLVLELGQEEGDLISPLIKL